MGKIMRRIVEFAYATSNLVGTLDDGNGEAGLLIVSGGNEIRIGAHRSMAALAQTIATKGYPVFRFDRRGIGDSEGANDGFESSGPDISTALAAFRAECPQVKRIVAFGNCDAATALILHAADVDHFILANPWVVEPIDDLPPPAAIKSHYLRRLKDPSAWRALVAGKLNIRNAIRGLRRISATDAAPQALTERVANALAHDHRPTTILLASGDITAIAFVDAWDGKNFEQARARPNLMLKHIDSSSHSFASDADFAILVETLRVALAQ